MCLRTVLVVEDELLVRMLLADTLLDQGYEVIEVGNVLEAVAVLGQREIDAVITDVDMPGGLSGLDLARLLSSTHASMPVIIASGGHQLSSMDLPGDAVFVSKPYGMDVILELVADMTSPGGRRIVG